MHANYAEIFWVGNIETDFQQIPHAQFFLKFSQYCCEPLIIEIHQRKIKEIFS